MNRRCRRLNVTQERAAALQVGDMSINEFCSNILAKPKWMENFEDMDEWKGGGRFGMEESVNISVKDYRDSNNRRRGA